MDLSKLPKLSESPPPPPVAAQPPEISYCHPPAYHTNRLEMGVDIWLSIMLGAVLELVGSRFGSYLIAKLSGHELDTAITWTTGPQAGQPAKYFDLLGGVAYGEMGFFIMGLAMMIDGLVLLLALKLGQFRKGLIIIAIASAVLGCFANIIACWMVFQSGVQPILSILILAMGGAMVIYQLRYLSEMSNSTQ